MPSVEALVQEDKRFRRFFRYVRERFFSSLAFIPLVALVGAVLLALVMYLIYLYSGRNMDPTGWFYGSTSSAMSVMSVIATSMLSFLAVVFSITLVALQLASQQFSPRVLRIFVRSTTTKITLGIFILTFGFSVIILALGAKIEEATTPILSLMVGLVLVFLSILAFVSFYRKIITMIRVGHMISMVAEETFAAIGENMPPEDAYVSCPLPALESPRQIIRYRKSRASILTSTQPRGVLQALDLARLTSVARKANCVLRVLPKTGDYISAGSAVVEVYGHAPLDPRHVLASFALGAERTLLQDPAYGFRGLVDVALQALSPAVNAPTTASQAICRLKELLFDIVERPIPTGYFADTDGVVRVVCPTTGWAEYVDLAFSEIIEFGISSSQIRRELSNTFAEMLEKLPVELQAPLARLSDKLRHAAEMVP